MSRKALVPIVLPADPVAAMEAATKQYVDAHAGGGAGADEVWIGPSDPGAAYELWYDTDETVPSVGAAPTGPAGGDLAGTYPNPTLAAGAVGTADLANGAVTEDKRAAGAIVSRIRTTDTAATTFPTATWATVPFNVSDFNNASADVSYSSNQFTVTRTGRWLLNTTFAFDVNPTGRRDGRIMWGGTQVASVRTTANTGVTTILSLQYLAYVSAQPATFWVDGYQASGGNLAVIGTAVGQCFFQIAYLGP